MIRWRFILTRIVIVTAIVVLLRLGLGPVAKYVTVRGLQALTGAKVEIAEARVGLFPPSVKYVDFRIADPRDQKEHRNAFRADAIELTIDGRALAHRRWIAREGRISGLQIGTHRDTSGHIERLDDDNHRDSGPSFLSRLVNASADKFADQTESATRDLETIRRSKQIRADWEGEYQRLTKRARNLEQSVRDIRDQARTIDNPLRDLPQLQETLARAAEFRNDLANVHRDMNALPKRLQSDLALLDEAREIDLAKLDKFVPGDLTDTDNFGVDMMANAVRKEIQRIRSYLDGGRTLANYTVIAPERVRVRGVNHGLNPVCRPSVMIRQCAVDGVMRANGEVYAISGKVQNMTPTPELLVDPTRVELRLEGPQTVIVNYQRDRRNHAIVDLLTLHWPDMKAESVRLGDGDGAGIAIDGGRRELWVQIRAEGENIEGHLRSKQTGVEMKLSVTEKFANTAAGISLADSLAAVDTIAMDARFTGTWKDLDLKLNTNLGQIFHRASQDAVNGQIQQSKQRLAAKINEAHSEQRRELTQWIGSRHREANELLAIADKSIQEMSKKVLHEAGQADALLGRLRSAIRGKTR